MLDFTVAIPTYNGANRLPQLLEKLRSQENIQHLNWEILIVDNNSTDNTQTFIKNTQNHWSHPFPLRYSFEPQQGAAFARQRAIREANSPLIGCLDDDVIPSCHWIATAYQYGQNYPQAGAYGGQIHGNFEIPPPENFQRIQSFLAIREGGEKPNLYDPKNLILPPSAAWVIRQQAWLESVPSRPRLGGRANGSMVQGDDYEPLLYLHQAGWKIWYFPELEVEHQIPAKRLERDYLIRLSRGSGLCMCHLRMINSQPLQKPLTFLTTLLGGLYRLIHHWLRYRQSLKTDLVAACEMAFFLSWFISPLYYLRQTAVTTLAQLTHSESTQKISTVTQQS